MSDLTNWVRDICEQYGHRIVAGLLLVMASVAFGIAQAATITASCTPPTLHTDGTPINLPISYAFHWGTSATALTNTVPATTCGATITVPSPAVGASITYYLAASAIVSGVSSVRTPVVSVVKSTPRPTPEPPTGLRVVETVAYRMDQSIANKPKFAQVGSVPLGTICHPYVSSTDINNLTLQLVGDRKIVTPVGSLPMAVYAKCS